MLFACCLHVEVTLKSVLARKCTLDEAPVYIVVPKVTPAWFQHDLSMTSAWHQHSHRNIWAHMYVTPVARLVARIQDIGIHALDVCTRWLRFVLLHQWRISGE